MLSMYRTLSLRYLRQRWTRAALIVCSIALGVATLVATLSLNATMDKAVQASANPLAGGADLMVSQGDSFLDGSLADQLARVRGVRAVRPILFREVLLYGPRDGQERTVLMVGVDVMKAMINKEEKSAASNPWGIKLDYWYQQMGAAVLRGDHICVLGEGLNSELAQKGGGATDRDAPVKVRAPGRKKTFLLTRVGTVTAEGAAAALGGSVLVTQRDTATAILGEKRGRVTRLDLTLEPGHDREQVRQRVRARLARLHSHAQVKTPEEQARSSQEVMAGMQAGFMLCGLGALVVGMFLVYNALSVSVAERRHEIGILRSLGATRLQVRGLFASEAAVLGLAGAVVGVPLGLGLAYLALEPMREVVSGIFRALEANRVEWTVQTVLIAVGAGMVTALLASLVPAFRASVEEPAVAVRRIPQNPTWTYRFIQLAVSAGLMAVGGVLILTRDLTDLPKRVGTHGGLVLVLLGALLATPLLAALAARLVQPLARRFLGIEGRLGADNLVRAPARTGLVIAALAAGVSLVLQTAGTIRSNRDAVRDWVERCLTADLVVLAGSPLSGGQKQLMEPDLGRKIQRLGGRDVRAVLPVRSRDDLPYGDTTVLLVAVEARRFAEVNRSRTPPVPGLDLYRRLSEQRGAVLVSENFAALYKVKAGDTITLEGVPLRVLGTVIDYAWNHGTVVMDRGYYTGHFKPDDRVVNEFDVYLRPGAGARKVQTLLGRNLGANKTVWTHAQLRQHIDDTIERLYAIAYGQQIVVGVVAALGVVTALLISVLQRRRELGVLRAIGASQAQVIRSVLAEATLMGVIGTAIGLVVGIPLEWYILQVVILEESGYFFPVTLPWLEAGVISAVALLIAAAAGIGPALHAVRERIPEAIAHE
jgi:putative ABC transport system permease protein